MQSLGDLLQNLVLMSTNFCLSNMTQQTYRIAITYASPFTHWVN